MHLHSWSNALAEKLRLRCTRSYESVSMCSCLSAWYFPLFFRFEYCQSLDSRDSLDYTVRNMGVAIKREGVVFLCLAVSQEMERRHTFWWVQMLCCKQQTCWWACGRGYAVMPRPFLRCITAWLHPILPSYSQAQNSHFRRYPAILSCCSFHHNLFYLKESCKKAISPPQFFPRISFYTAHPTWREVRQS